MRFWWSIILRPLFFLILLGLLLFMLYKLRSITKQLEHNLILNTKEVRNKTFSEIQTSAKLLITQNSSASSLARFLSSSLNGTEMTFSIIQEKVAPPLFLLFSTIPYVSQVVYSGSDGLSFSYYIDDDQTFAVFSNTTFPSVSYSQPVNRDTGMLYGQAIGLNSTYTIDGRRLQNASDMTMAYSSLEVGWNHDDLLFQNTIAMYGRGIISVGYAAQVVIDHFSSLDFHGGYFHLASNDGIELVGTRLPDTQIVVDNGTISVRLLKLDGNLQDKVTNHSCNLDDGELSQFRVKINGKGHVFYCSTVQIAGVKLVYSLAFPSNGMESVAQKISKLAITLLVLMLVIIVIAISVFIIFIARAARREMFLCAALIKQMESTQQAERKSMNKSMAFARASHDVRGSLAAITGLIELCHEDAKPDSELASNLTQINTCATDVLGILNSVLDTSKIEAGKMQLEEEEFDLAQVLDEVVDMYYPLGFKKGVDVILDLSDGSIFKFYLVKGDRGKFKQILCNLLSNAIKFTSEGHIVVRSIVRKPSKENAIIASNRLSVLSCLTKLCSKTNESFSSLDELHPVQEDPNCMEFVFEVEDTGTGIPKERQKSVFENFVQVKETAFGQEGSGLGLGIVQSLVRLMGGEIQIVDKEHGEKGTCFRFNIFLTCNAESTETEEQGNYIHTGGTSTDVLHYIGLHIRSPVNKLEGSHVILLLAGEERRKISRKVMENFGVKVSVAKRCKDLFRILEMIKERMDLLQCSSSELSPVDYLSASSNSNLASNEGCSRTKDGNDHILHNKKSNSRSSINFILIVIDANAGPFMELCSIVSSFKKETPNLRCKVVWLENLNIRNDDSRKPGENRPSPPCDYILSKPLHGSRLYQVLGLLPEFGGDKVKAATSAQENEHLAEILPSNNLTGISHGSELQKGIVSPGRNQQLQEIIIHENTDKSCDEKPLKGKSVLVADDDAVLRKLTDTILSKLGAEVDVCVNGKEAFDLVCKRLRDQEDVHPKSLPYDFIFIDCEMPVMDGYEATRLIRKEEKSHGIHIPIFALTAHAIDEATSKIADSGMDFHLSKPLKVDKLLDAIRLLCTECR